MKKIITMCMLLGLFTYASAQDNLLKPAQSTKGQDSLINAATKLHDEGKYDDAIKLYLQVLKENPSNIMALYEIAYSFSAKNDYESTLKYCDEGLKYSSIVHPYFYLIKGNVLDNIGKSSEAIRNYKTGIKNEPNTYILPYNLGLTYYNCKMPDSAKYYLRNAITMKPNHPSSNILLGQIYAESNKRIEAFLAISKFLILEPVTERSKSALNLYQNLINSFAVVDSSGGGKTKININLLTAEGDKEDGKTNMLELAMGMACASAIGEKKDSDSQLKRLVNIFDSFFQMMVEFSEKEKFDGFIGKNYIPFFVEMKNKGYVEVFTYYVFSISGNDEIITWLKANMAKVNEFIKWSTNYN